MDIDTAGPLKVVSQFNESLVRLTKQNREMLKEMGGCVRDESAQFVNLRMDRNSQALEKLHAAQGLSGVIAAQQEWLRDFLQDYAEQNLRLAGIFRGLAHNALASASDIASQNMGQMEQAGKTMAGQAQDVAAETSQAVADGAQDMNNQVQNNYQQDTQH